ncbi:NAD(P)H-binding protein [Streptomyces boninensis]|uniref:NAD(P)H-binding protein n=1 Tax=Streptomyces boninensis TaxID=2039455 RepID=UPI003B2280D8
MIVITTPTGQIGSQTLDRLLAEPGAAPAVRVIARDPARLPARVRERVEVVQGSHADPDVLDTAYDGADAVLWLTPPPLTAPELEPHFRDFTLPTCAAIERHAVGRVVGVSTLGRGVAKRAGHITAALAMDELIERTGVPYRALCMPGFMENLLPQAPAITAESCFRTPVPLDHRLPTCATRDIAAVAARLLLDGSWNGQEDVPVLGPEDLSPREMAAVMSEVLGREIRAEAVSVEAYRAGMLAHGASEAAAQGLADMMTEVVGRDLYDRERYAATAAPSPTTFRQWCADVLAPALGAGAARAS